MRNMGSLSRRQFLHRVAALSAAGVAAGRLASAAEPAAAKPSSSWQIGCYTRPWAAHDYRVALDAIAEAGYKYAGLMTTNTPNHLVISVDTKPEEAQKIGEECKARKLEVPSCYGGDIPVATSLEAGIEGLKKLIDNCAAAGVRNLMMGGIGDDKLYDAYFGAIAACCDYAAGKSIAISMKPHGGLNATGPQCRKSIEKVGNKNFRLWYDPGNIFYYSDNKLNPIDDAASVDGLVAGMSVKDFLPPKTVELLPGTGQVDFPKVMARLRQGGFTSGPLIVECLAPGDLPQLLAQAKQAREFVEKLVS
jgi:sugar phosphate isomerase/epimerase